MKCDVFISYSRIDYVDHKTHKAIPGNVISKLMDAFDKEGITYWIDKEGIHSGDAWAKLIGKAIGDSTVFLFVSSINSNRSDCWSADEIALARNKRKHIIPFLLDDTPFNDEFALFIARLDYVDYASIGDAAIPKLLDSLEIILDSKDPNRKAIRELKKQQSELRDEINRKESERRYVISKLKELGVDVNDEPTLDTEEVKRLKRVLEANDGELRVLRKRNADLQSEKDILMAECQNLQNSLEEYKKLKEALTTEIEQKNAEIKRWEKACKGKVWFDESCNSLRWLDKEYKLIPIAGGTFEMGSTSILDNDAAPIHKVTLGDYMLGKTAVTHELWEAVMGNNPSVFKGKDLPVENVSWEDCQAFICKLNSLTGKKFRMPTETEWEYAARGGKNSGGYMFSCSNSIDDVAWYSSNSSDKTHPVGLKKANELGLYDMLGNVWEWCSDWYGSYSSGSAKNPSGPSSGSLRVNRGGGYNATRCRVSNRSGHYPGYHYINLGLRLAL